jgi:predicted Ser/Thr protein kinase
MEPIVPRKFGRYEIKAEIGRGGMATVYHAYDPRFEREVALKVLPREMLHDVQFRVRFEREAKTIAMLEHPAIVAVYDFGEEDGQPYFVMRYMTGGSLSDRMKKGPMTVQEAAHLVAHIAPGLDEAHAKHIVHRDLKPGNILFDQFNEPYISDFGIAKLSESQTNVTGSAIIGTPAYMSPEQAQGEGIDGRSDIYALGVILFEMLTGQQPYHGDTPMSVVVKQITDPVPHILDVKPDLPADMEVIIDKAMAKDRKERFQDVRSLSNALNAVARGERLSLGTSDSTMMASSRTVVATRPASQPLPGTVIARRPQVPQAVEQVQAPVAPRRKTGLWIGLGVGILLLFVAAGIGISFLRNKTPSLAASVPTQTYTVIQPSPTAVVEAPAATSAVVVEPVASDTPAPTETPAPSPKPTITLPSAPTEFKVLWDISHGPRLSQDGSAYTPDGMYKSLVQTLAGDKFIISSGDLTNLDTYDVLVLSGLSATNMPYTSSEADKIEQFIRVSGHGLLLMSDIPGFGNHADVVSRRFSIGLGDSVSDGPVSYSNEPFFLGVTSVLYLFQGGVFQVSSPSQTAAVDKGGNSVIAFCECDAGRVMAISDANLWDNRGLSQADNQRFATNVFLWLVKSSP